MQGVDPKPSDLPMARVKPGNTPVEARTVLVENSSDELWVGVKGQSNSVIAGSPRNSFRASVVELHMRR